MTTCNLQSRNRWFAVSFIAILTVAAPALAAIDTLQTVVDRAAATGNGTASGPAIGAFAYNPTDDSMFVTSFGSSGSTRKVTNVSGAQASSRYISWGQMQLYLTDGDSNRGTINPTQSGMLFNPVAIGSGEDAVAPYSMAIIAEIASTNLPGGSTRDPSATKRFYSYNLQAVADDSDAQSVMATLATLSDMQAAISTTSTVSNQGRQFAWSGDGQTAYFIDAGNATTAYGGLWKLNPITGAVQRLAAETGIFTEPAVLSQGGVDTIYVGGGGTTSNAGGIDNFTYDGNTVGARSVAVSAAVLKTFFDAAPEQVPDVGAMTADAAGNLYFTNEDGTPERRGLFKLDVEGRISKVVSYAERDLYFTGALGATPTPNSGMLRMQPRTVNHLTAGNVTQILYAEPGASMSFVAGAYVFETGDFDRNGVAGQAADKALFVAALKTRGTALTNVDDYKFDLNANSVVDWKDVKILQQFVDLPNGDANFDGVLDLVDLDVVGLNYYTTSPSATKTWATGDFASVDPLYAANAVDANIVNLVDLQLFADTWLNVLEQPITESQLTSRGYGGQFLTDLLDVFGFNTGLDGDFDLNGLVDGADFLLWQRQFGTTVDAGTGADADGNGTIDATDLAVWKENFGAGGTLEVAAAAVPEPSSLLLGTLAVAGIASLRRRQSVR